jgi:hypothetical protein
MDTLIFQSVVFIVVSVMTYHAISQFLAMKNLFIDESELLLPSSVLPQDGAFNVYRAHELIVQRITIENMGEKVNYNTAKQYDLFIGWKQQAADYVRDYRRLTRSS